MKMLGSGISLNYDFDKIYNEKDTLLSISDPTKVDDLIRISK